MLIVGRFPLLALGLALAFQAYAYTVPVNDGFVTDTVGILSEQEQQQIEATLSAYRQETSNEIAVLILDSLNGEPIADVAVQVGREWGVGTEEDDNGILLLIAYSDRELFLATGYGLEGAVPDIVAKGVIDTEITPFFRNGQYADGITAGIEALKRHIGGEFTADRYSESESSFPSGAAVFAFFLVLQALGAFLARSKSWWLGGVLGAVFGLVLVILFSWWISIPILTAVGLLFDYIVSRGGRGGRGGFHGGMWGGGSSRGGGFGGFSGGSFGGGGAGGKW